MSRIKITEGGFGKRKPSGTGGTNSKKKVEMAMQLAALNRIAFTIDDVAKEEKIEFFGYIPKEKYNIQFYIFSDPEVKKGELEMKYILKNGDLGVIRMKGGNQFMFTGREEGTEVFRIAAKASIDGREIDFKNSKAVPGMAYICYKDSAEICEIEMQTVSL